MTTATHTIETLTAEILNQIRQEPKPTKPAKPHPELTGNTRVTVECHGCGGAGHYYICSGWAGEVACRYCNGTGQSTALVSSLRAKVNRKYKKSLNEWQERQDNAKKLAQDTARETMEAERKQQEASDKRRQLQAQLRQLEENYTAGDRVETTATVTKAITFNRQAWNGYGTETVALITFTTAEGDEMIWFSTGNKAFDLLADHRDAEEEGKTITLTLKATVKRVQQRNKDTTPQVAVTRATFKR